MSQLLLLYSLNESNSPYEKLYAIEEYFKDLQKIYISGEDIKDKGILDKSESCKEYWESFDEVPLTKKHSCELIRFKTLEFLQICLYYSQRRSSNLSFIGLFLKQFKKKIENILSFTIKD
jgi:hypothetical protein